MATESVFFKISFASGADKYGAYWEFCESNTENKWGFKPAWTVRLRKHELHELFLAILGEFTRMPLPSDNNFPGERKCIQCRLL